MTKIAIINHDEHRLYIEDVSDEDLAKYNGEEEDYIKDNYNLENYSWDYITGAIYMAEGEEEFTDIDFKKIA